MGFIKQRMTFCFVKYFHGFEYICKGKTLVFFFLKVKIIHRTGGNLGGKVERREGRERDEKM